jgi:hypothetical protein
MQISRGPAQVQGYHASVSYRRWQIEPGRNSARSTSYKHTALASLLAGPHTLPRSSTLARPNQLPNQAKASTPCRARTAVVCLMAFGCRGGWLQQVTPGDAVLDCRAVVTCYAWLVTHGLLRMALSSAPEGRGADGVDAMLNG